ncbi:MAG: hypothetical protein HY239_07230 [Mycolicibacterium aromaticivorans]|nr:hypothetical protein [Mycolicibacterium aromaticivorans]
MAVTPDKPGFVSRQWRSVMQRGIDTVSEYADVAAQKLSAVSDPRARLLRKRRWALRLGLFFSFATVFWVAVTGLLATWSTPVWGLIITGVIAAGAAVPATLFLLRYRWLRGEPLSALGASERGFHSLLGVMQRGNMLPPEEIRELVAAADRTAATMAATADEVVSMESAAIETPHSQSYLAPTINAFTAQLSTGVRQYNEMVTAAAQLVSAANTGAMSSSPMSQQRYRNELAGATDRLMGWAQAFDELGQLRRA